MGERLICVKQIMQIQQNLKKIVYLIHENFHKNTSNIQKISIITQAP